MGVQKPTWAPSQLERLPLHLLESICAFVGLPERDGDLSDILAFSLASRTCCAAIERQRFHHIPITIRGRKKLRQEVKRWQEILHAGQGNRAAYVRTLKLSGRMEVASDMNEEGDDVAETIDSAANQDDTRTREIGDEKKWIDEAWAPLAQLIRMLPYLQDVIYECSDQIPASILSTIHQNQPGSRLHIKYFHLRSLVHPIHDSRAVDPDELILATSPCLHSLKARITGYDAMGNIDYNQEAVEAMVRGLAPNLKHVRTWNVSPGDSPAFRRAISSPRPSWLGFGVEVPGSQSRKGSLQSLSFTSGPLSIQLKRWSDYADFRKLDSLEISDASLATVQLLAQMARDDPLNPKSLTLHFDGYGTGKVTDSDQVMADLLLALGPLEDLKLTGVILKNTLDAIKSRHVRTLRQLKLRSGATYPNGPREFSFTPTSNYVREFLEQALLLETLEFLVPRTKGDEDEVLMYQSLGRLPRLRYLTLFLDCEVENPSPRPTKRWIRNSYINYAIDPDLALSIFSAVDSTKAIRMLQINPCRWSETWMRCDSYTSKMRWLGRKWMVQRNQKGEVKIDEMDVEERLEAVNKVQDDREYTSKEGKFYKTVWDELWPETTERWWEDWSSFPLAEASPPSALPSINR